MHYRHIFTSNLEFWYILYMLVLVSDVCYACMLVYLCVRVCACVTHHSRSSRSLPLSLLPSDWSLCSPAVGNPPPPRTHTDTPLRPEHPHALSLRMMGKNRPWANCLHARVYLNCTAPFTNTNTAPANQRAVSDQRLIQVDLLSVSTQAKRLNHSSCATQPKHPWLHSLKVPRSKVLSPWGRGPSSNRIHMCTELLRSSMNGTEADRIKELSTGGRKRERIGLAYEGLKDEMRKINQKLKAPGAEQ